MSAPTRQGKMCGKHPELKGLRYWSNSACLGCVKDRTQARRKADWAAYLDHSKKRLRRRLAERKRQVIDHYGGQCRRCAEKDIDVLTLDHKKENGGAHRREIFGDKKASRIYAWAIRNGFPKLFQVLCFNCNFKKHRDWARRKQRTKE